MFAYIYHTNQPSLGRCTIPGYYAIGKKHKQQKNKIGKFWWVFVSQIRLPTKQFWHHNQIWKDPFSRCCEVPCPGWFVGRCHYCYPIRNKTHNDVFFVHAFLVEKRATTLGCLGRIRWYVQKNCPSQAWHWTRVFFVRWRFLWYKNRKVTPPKIHMSPKKGPWFLKRK